MRNCELCNAIPFEKLPSEEEDALPHQPSLDALEQSSKECQLCQLIWWAAGCSLKTSGGMVKYSNLKLPSGRQINAQFAESNYGGLGIMHALENGAVFLDTSSAKADLREPIFIDPHSRFPRGANVRPWLFGNWYKSPFKSEHFQLVGLGVRVGAGPGIEEADGNSQGEANIRGTYLRLRTDDGTDTAATIPGRLRVDDQSSEIAFRRVKDWLWRCDKGHSCAKSHSCSNDKASSPLPTRVLNVNGPEDVIKLLETNGLRGRYLALSHCWGLSHRITTTIATLRKHEEGIPLSQLPVTFQEAVKIARELEVPYLWIDSLCIIQDDAAHWEVEASKMGQVYAYSYLTISALSSEDDSSGCFSRGGPKTVSAEKPYVSCDTLSTGRRCFFLAAPLVVSYHGDEVDCRVFRPFGMRGGRKSRVHVTPEWMPSSLKQKPETYLVGEFGRKVDPFEYEPLSTRCWTLQERLLSPRTLHYSTQGMYWECQSYVLAEDGALLTREFPTIPEVLESRIPHTDVKDSDISRRREQHESGIPSRRKWPNPWLKLVEEYTSRNLTRGQDKLPALSGLANLIASQTGDAYFAGLWRGDLLQCLYWSIETFEPHHNCDDPEHDAAMPPATKSNVIFPSEYRAPSWSWAALDAKIEYHPLNTEKIQARVLEVHVFPAGKDPFGKVQSGWIRLEGVLYVLFQANADEKTRKHFPFTVPVEARSGRLTRNGNVNFDSEPYFPSFALLLDDTHAVLLSARGQGIFNRIGTATLHDLKNDERGSSVDPGARGDAGHGVKSSNPVEEIQAAELANGSQQGVTIF